MQGRDTGTGMEMEFRRAVSRYKARGSKQPDPNALAGLHRTHCMNLISTAEPAGKIKRLRDRELIHTNALGFS